MLKSFILGSIIALLVSGTAWAQTSTPSYGPSYYRLENTLTAGTKVVINQNFTVNPTPLRQMYIISDEAKFYVSGYRYMNGVWVKVFPQGTSASDSAVYWHANIALPISDKIDVLCFKSALSDGGADLVVYK